MAQKRQGFIGDLKTAIKSLGKICAIKLPQRYTKTIASLIWQERFEENCRMTLFAGGPLKYDRHGINDAWFFPVEILFYGPNGDERINFHVIAVNCDKGRDLTSAEVLYNFSTDDSLKLEDVNDPSVFEFHNAILASTKHRRVMVRVALTGSLAFPIITTSLDNVSAEGIKLGLNMLSQHFGYSAKTDDCDSKIEALLAKHAINFDECTIGEDGEIRAREKVIVSKKHGTIYVNEIINTETTAWKVYRLYSTVPLNSISSRPRLFVRIDSGCSIGMNYLDKGCDCLDQLAGALEEIRKRRGIVVHLPTQDGRGYGDASKIHTEGLKHGLNPLNREEMLEVNTVDAAQTLFGNQIDIRTYSHAGKILGKLGFKSMSIYTENFFKSWSIGRGAETRDVEIELTDTIEKSYPVDPITSLNSFSKLVHNYQTIQDVTDDVEQYKDILNKQANKLLQLMGKDYIGLSLDEKIRRIDAEQKRLSSDRTKKG